jgi:hypothetical protein
MESLTLSFMTPEGKKVSIAVNDTDDSKAFSFAMMEKLQLPNYRVGQ